MQTADVSTEAKERIIRRLVEEKFIDEIRFCRSFVNDKLRFNKWGRNDKLRFNKWGRIKIDFELRNRGIDASIRENALNQIDEQYYYDILFSILKDKKKSVKAKDNREEFLKLLRFAAGRGFETNLASRCLKQLVRGGEDEDFA